MPVLSTPCTEWPGGHSNGYGWIGGYVRQYAHRWTWEQAHGAIPAGLEVMHICDNKGCVNLDHLALGTHAANMAMAALHGLRTPPVITHCKRGHEFTEANTYRPPGQSRRQCRACRALATARYAGRVG